MKRALPDLLGRHCLFDGSRPRRAQPGKYVVTADTLSLTFADQPVRTFTYRIAGYTLYLNYPTGKRVPTCVPVIAIGTVKGA